MHMGTNGNDTNLQWGRFSLDIRKKPFTVGVVAHWDRLHSEVADALYLSVVKRHLDNALDVQRWS